MYLHKQGKKYKGKDYTYYSIAESYIDEKGQSKKKILFRLGKLSDEKVKQIRQVLAISNNKDTIVMTLNDLSFQDSWSYLDLVFLHEVWQEWNLEKAFLPTDNEVSTSSIAEALTINLCLDPSNLRKVVEWFPNTVLAHLLKVSPEKFNVDCICHELSTLNKQKELLEKFLVEQVSKRDPEGIFILFYDLTEGQKSEIKPIVLALVVNENGYPLMWDILKSTTDLETIEYLIKKCKKTMSCPLITLVFEQDMVNTDIESVAKKYITALDKNKIPGIVGSTLLDFKNLDLNNHEDELLKLCYKKFDHQLYYLDLGIIDNHRYIIGLNPILMLEERKLRNKLLEELKQELKELNTSLQLAPKSHKKNAIEKEVLKLIEQKHAKQLVDWSLEDLTIEKEGKIHSFQVKYSLCLEKIAEKQLLDGVCLFVTNHTEKNNNSYEMSAESIVSAYRNINEVEETFKNVKSFLDFQSIYENKDEHIRAYYTICILAYLLNVTIRNKIRKSKKIKDCSLDTFYKKLEDCQLAELSIKGEEESVKKLKQLNKEQKIILKEFGYEKITRKQFIENIFK